MKHLYLFGILSAALLLSACGGGSGNCTASALGIGLLSCLGESDKNSPPVIETGRFLDAAVEGLTYETPSRSGTTNANGEFTYIAGETVTFKLFDVTIGSILGTRIVTPNLIAAASASPDFSLNLLRFLQSIDTDQNLENGITLPSVAPLSGLDFNQSIADFATAASAGGLTLVSASTALLHFQSTLNNLTYDSAYAFNYAGKTMRAYPYGCSNTIVAFELSFSATGATLVSGTDSVIRNSDGSCTAKVADENDLGVEFSYAELARDGFINPCSASTCTLSQLNNVYTGTDIDERSFTTVVAHKQDTNQIVITKYINRDGVTTCQHTYLLTFQ